MFKLNIECTRDFDELHIVFSDGSSTVVTNKRKDEKLDKLENTDDHDKQSKSSKPSKDSFQCQSKSRHKNDLLDTDADFGSIPQDIVEKPVISERERPVKVAEELQNLDI